MTAHEQDLALRAVGRNVFNFQLLEGCLKQLAQFQPVDGTALEIRRKLGTRTERLSKSTLGSAIAGWLNLLDPIQPTTGLGDDLFDVTALIALSVELTDDERSRHAAALENLLGERNTLVHAGLLSVDWTSPDVCRKLAADLDAQNERIIKEIEFLRPILIEFRKVVNATSEIDWTAATTETTKEVKEKHRSNRRPESET